MTRFYIFLLRIFLGAGFAVILMRMFYPDANLWYVAGLAIILVSLAYLLEYFKNRKGG